MECININYFIYFDLCFVGSDSWGAKLHPVKQQVQIGSIESMYI